MIKNLDKKLSGEIPVNYKDLMELVNSWGRSESQTVFEKINIKKCEPKECYNLSNLDVSKIDDLSYIFAYSPYNGDLSRWNISNCENMLNTFRLSHFNNDSICNWDVSNVLFMKSLFYQSKFNQDLSKWNINSCKNISYIFAFSEFNNDSLKNWKTSNIIYFNSAFSNSIFNGNISNWKFDKAISLSDMFNNSKFNGDISKWDISNCTHMKEMFSYSTFSNDISSWKFHPNVICDEIFINNKSFMNKYNNGNQIPKNTNDFLQWFEENREKMRELNITKEEVLDFFDFNDNIQLSNTH